MLAHDIIATTLRLNAGPESACTSLLTQANDNGGRDNVTVVVADFDVPGQ